MAIYAVDFDGTLAVTRFPEIVEPKRKIVAAVKMLKANGHKVILWTSRAGRDLEAAVEWCHGQGLEFDAVNEPLPEQVARWGNDTRKVYCHIDIYEVQEMEIDVYLFFMREAMIFENSKTDEGREYLRNCWRMEQTKPDREGLRKKFKKRGG